VYCGNEGASAAAHEVYDFQNVAAFDLGLGQPVPVQDLTVVLDDHHRGV
jgi:hypothetical protein